METVETVASPCKTIKVERHVWCWNLQHIGQVFINQSWYETWLVEVHHRKGFAHIHGGKRNNYPLCAFGTFFESRVALYWRCLRPQAQIKLTSFTTVLATWSSGNTDLHKDSWWMMQRRTIKSKLGLSSLTRSWFLCSSLIFFPIRFVSGHVQQCSPWQVQSLRASWYSILSLTGPIAMDSMARTPPLFQTCHWSLKWK